MKLKLAELDVTSFLTRSIMNSNDESGPITIGIVPCDTEEDCAAKDK